MKTTLVQHGDQKALIVDESLLEQLMIDMPKSTFGGSFLHEAYL